MYGKIRQAHNDSRFNECPPNLYQATPFWMGGCTSMLGYGYVIPPGVDRHGLYISHLLTSSLDAISRQLFLARIDVLDL